MEIFERKEIIRSIYLYLFSLIGLILIIIGCIQLTNLALKVLVFPGADQVIIYPTSRIDPEVTADPVEEAIREQEQIEYQTQERSASRQRTAANALAMIIIGTPLYLYHWRAIQNKDSRHQKQAVT
jgi:hypothetical protein